MTRAERLLAAAREQAGRGDHDRALELLAKADSAAAWDGVGAGTGIRKTIEQAIVEVRRA